MRLNIGGGRGPRMEGFEIVDRSVGKEAYPLPHPDDSVDEIYASHILEHFAHHKCQDVLRDWVRALKPGGRIRIAVPDFAYVVEKYSAGEEINAVGYVMGGHINDDDRHGMIFDEGLLSDMMRSVGINDIRRWKPFQPDASALPVSLNLEGFKRTPVEVKDVQAIISLPRLAFTENWFSALQALVPLKINLSKCTGVFWHQGVTHLMEQFVADGRTKYILTLDYDTVFRRQDVEDLYALMEANPGVGAVCATQIGRERKTVLLTKRGPDGKNVSQVSGDELRQDLLPITTGHFGLTLIRAELVAKLPKPWFAHSPAPNGGWGEGRTDDDIWFWRQWEKAGNTVCQANRVIVGHMQQVVAWPNRELAPVFQLVSEYQKLGIPTVVLR